MDMARGRPGGLRAAGFERSLLGAPLAGLLPILLAALIALVAAAGMPARAQAADVIDGIVALVDDQPILRSEVLGRLMLEVEQRGIDPADTTTLLRLRDFVLENLIDERVLELYAKEQGLTVSDEQVNRMVEDAVERNRQAIGSEEMFRAQLEREGLTEVELRQKFAAEARRRMLADRVLEAELGGPVEVSPEEVRRYFDENQSQLPEREQAVHLQRIVILVEPDSLQVQRVNEAAADVLRRIRSGELAFAEAARRYSDDPNTSRSGGNLGRIERGDLAGRLGKAFEDRVFALETNRVSEPLRSPLGFHLMLVSDRDPDGQWVSLSHILFSVPLVRADQMRAEAEANRIREQAVAGGNFEELAQRYSDAPEGARGGDVGLVPVRVLEESLRQALDKLKPNEVSEVLFLDTAYLIARYTERQESRPYTFDEIKDELTEHVRQVRTEERFRAWADKLRDRYSIERRPWE